MATATMATAAGVAALLYYTLNRKLPSSNSDNDDYETERFVSTNASLGSERISNRLIQAPATWVETISTLSETLKFTYSETLGKWPIGDLAFGISFLLKSQGNLPLSNVFGGDDCLQLKGSDIIAELSYLLKLLTLCWHFSKKPFPLFLQETGYLEGNVLLQEPKAGILKPAFTILSDHKEKCFLLMIRGTHSIKDTLTAATGAMVPFHHTVVHEGGVSDVVLGYAHCGMVAAARWIAKLATPRLLKALEKYPDYNLKIVGHSLGGGTAALLTYVMREQKEFSTATCVTFAPAACMTWELAESGNEFITSVINGADLVPTFSAASVDDLRAEVTASAWLNDLRNQIERTRILGAFYRSASALGSRLPSISSARAKVAGAGALLRPVSNGTQVVMKRAQSMAQAALTRPAMRLSSLSCIGPRLRSKASCSKVSEVDDSLETENQSGIQPPEPFITCHHRTTSIAEAVELPVSSDEGLEWSSEIDCPSCSKGLDPHTNDNDISDDLIGHDKLEDRMTEVELWQQLERELYRRETEEGEADVAREIREEEAAAMAEVGQAESIHNGRSGQQKKEAHRFFPPGKIMHIVPISHMPETDSDDSSRSSMSSRESENVVEDEVGIFLTPRSLYSKIRLSHSMINDHFMPVYRRQMEKIIKQLEKDEEADGTLLQ
ncbi:hypothetical protein SAY86_023801 [Trapa natans]|uniref:Sn1-specific diacylglycerol lipase alpha n=1 Tax=Trapa natans TaxID=22666 RepID=A0AAN7RAJ9_TRANT|nr:hypothetical protein SAY86_023801 [Trapa natans]